MTNIQTERRAENRRAQLNKGIVEMALLFLLRDKPRYGLELLDQLNETAGLGVAEGTIYPMLHRLKDAGLVGAEWHADDPDERPRKYYTLTPAGRTELDAMLDEWRQLRRSLDSLMKEQGK